LLTAILRLPGLGEVAPSPGGGAFGPPLNAWFTGPTPESTRQTASRSVQPFCSAHGCGQQTHTQTHCTLAPPDEYGSRRAHGCGQQTRTHTDHATSVTIGRILLYGGYGLVILTLNTIHHQPYKPPPKPGSRQMYAMVVLRAGVRVSGGYIA